MLQFKKVDFGEKPFVSFSVAMDPDKVRTKAGKNYAVTPVSLVYQNKRSFFEPLIPLSVAFTVPSKQAVPAQNAHGETLIILPTLSNDCIMLRNMPRNLTICLPGAVHKFI